MSFSIAEYHHHPSIHLYRLILFIHPSDHHCCINVLAMVDLGWYSTMIHVIAYHCKSVNRERGRSLATPGQALIGSGTGNCSWHQHPDYYHSFLSMTCHLLATNPYINKSTSQLIIYNPPIHFITMILNLVNDLSRVTTDIIIVAFWQSQKGMDLLKTT